MECKTVTSPQKLPRSCGGASQAWRRDTSPVEENTELLDTETFFLSSLALHSGSPNFLPYLTWLRELASSRKSSGCLHLETMFLQAFSSSDGRSYYPPVCSSQRPGASPPLFPLTNVPFTCRSLAHLDSHLWLLAPAISSSHPSSG